MSSTTPNPDVDPDAAVDASVLEADAVAAKQYRKWLRKLWLVGTPFVAGAMALMMMGGALSIAGVVAPLFLAAAYPMAGVVVWLYYSQWVGKPIRRMRTLLVRALAPWAVMSAVILLSRWFIPFDQIVALIVGEKHSPIKTYGYDGLPGFWAFVMLWATHSAGLYAYIYLFRPIYDRRYSLATTGRRVRWFGAMVLAAIPWLLLMGSYVSEQ